MNYPNVETFLNEEIRKPIKEKLKDGKNEEAMEIVDFLCDKYREMNGMAIFYESKLKTTPNLFREYMDFMKLKGYLAKTNYDLLDEYLNEWED